MPGADDSLLMATPLPGGRRRAGRTRRPRRSSGARSRPCRRCAPGATASAPSPAGRSRRGSRAAGYEATAEHVARLARLEWTSEAGEPVATVAVPGATVAVFASDAVDLEAEQRRSAARRTAARSRDREAEGKLSNEGFVAKAPEAVVQGGARQARAAAGGARGALTWTEQRAEEHLLSLELFGMRFGLERMRRLLTALGSPQERFAAIHVVGTNGKSSTVRMTAALLEAARRAHGLLPLAAPGPLRRAHPDRRRGPLRRGVRRRDPARRGGRRQGRPHALGRRARDPVRAADRRRARRAGPQRRRGRGRRGRPGRALGRHQRARRGRLRAHQRRPGAHALARPHGGRHRPREARRGPAVRDARTGRGGRRGARAGARRRREDRACRSRSTSRCAATSARTSRSPPRRPPPSRARCRRRRSPRSPPACACRAACRSWGRTR